MTKVEILINTLINKFADQIISRPQIFQTAFELNFDSKIARMVVNNKAHKQGHGKYKIDPTAEIPKTDKEMKKELKEQIETAPEETDEQILKRIKDRFDILERLAVSAALGETRSLIVSGPPGLGKTHTITETIMPAAKNTKMISGSSSSIGIFRALHETKEVGSVLIIDDCDSVFFDIASLNLIKAACDSTKKRVIRWCSDYHFGSDAIDREFEYKGTIVFITNIDFDQQLSNEKSKLYPHIQALMSRSHYISIGIKSRRDFLIRIKQVIEELFETKEFEKQEAIDCYKFIVQNVSTLRELSIRTAIKLIQLRKSIPEDWERVARISLCKA